MAATSLDHEAASKTTVGVTIVMPCLNEAPWLPACVANARAALHLIHTVHGLSGEIVVADNGSTDGSRDVAASHGARVVSVTQHGYGAAIIGGITAARGQYVIMGDADGSYDFRNSAEMIARLRAGADICMGSRFLGTIHKGAMPWKNRYIGNPILTFILNLFFGAGISDAHCGLRAFTRDAFHKLRLTGRGMEFASEMIIKAALKGLRIDEAPADLHRDLRNRPPHLRPWRDGWRHLRYLLMLSPSSIFGYPAVVAGTISLAILLYATHVLLAGETGQSVVGNYWVILAGAMLGISHVTGLLAAATQLYGVREGYRRPSALSRSLARWVTLESMLISGFGAVVAGLVILGSVVAYWSSASYGPMANVLPAVAGTSLIVIGIQNALGGFLLAILGGHEADFLQEIATDPATSESVQVAIGADRHAA